MERSLVLYEKIRKTVVSLTRLKDFCAVITNLVVPTIIAIVCGFQKEIVNFSPSAFYIPIILCALFSLVYCWISFGIKTSAEVLVELDENTEIIKKLERAVDIFSTIDALCTAWRGLVDESVRNLALNESNITDIISVMFSLIIDNKDDLYQFKRGELWNFAVYKFDNNRNSLMCIWRDKSPDHPGDQVGRFWRPGQGHVGITFSNRSGKRTLDARMPEVAALLRAPRESARGYDNETYVALQTEPVLLNETDVPWGVIVATSNVPQRFDEINGIALNHLAGEIGSLIKTNSSRLPVK